MEQTNSALKQNLRRIAMILGFTFFAFFIYKAGHEVSNPKIAAGAQRTQVVNASSKAVPGIGTGNPNYTISAPMVNPSAVVGQDSEAAAAEGQAVSAKKSSASTDSDTKSKTDSIKETKQTSSPHSRQVED